MEDKIREEIVEKFGESFDTITLEATLKSDTIDALAESISYLTKSNIALTQANVDLTATNKKLITQLESTKGRRIQHSNQPSNNTMTNENQEWPSWCEPDTYCFTCGCKMKKGHDCSNCPKARNNPNHKKEATRNNTMGVIRMNMVFGNSPNGK